MTRIVTLTPNAALDIWTETERVQPGHKLRCSAPVVDAGGGGINVSRVLVRLGADTIAIYAAGGSVGDRLAARLADEGVPAERVPTSGDTRESISVMDRTTHDVYRFVLPGPMLSDADAAALLARFEAHCAEAALAIGSGSLPPGLPVTFWAETAAAAKRAGCRFVLDSVSGVAQALEVGVFLLRLTSEEVALVTGQAHAWPDGYAAWARDVIAGGNAEMIVVAQGAQGGLIASRDVAFVMHPPRVEVVSAVGGGDSFVAGLADALAHGRPADQALKQAVITAAATMLTPATELCHPDAVARLMREAEEPHRLERPGSSLPTFAAVNPSRGPGSRT